MRLHVLLTTLAALLLAVPTAVAGEAEGVTLPVHCTIPTTVECIEDWVDAVFDGRWVRFVLCLAGHEHWCLS